MVGDGRGEEAEGDGGGVELFVQIGRCSGVQEDARHGM